MVATAPLTAATALTVLSGSVWTYQLARSEFDTSIFLSRVTAKVAEKVNWRIIQSGAVYLSLDFVILFCLSCEGLPGQ